MLSDILNRPGAPVVAKHAALDAFCSLLGGPRPLLLRRPPGYGIDVFTSMLMGRLDEGYDMEDFTLCFLDSGSWPRTGLHEYLVLNLDLSQLDEDSTKLRHQIFRHCMSRGRAFFEDNPGAIQFMDEFPSAKSFGKDPHGIITTLGLLLQEYGQKLIVVVNEFDAPAYQLNFFGKTKVLDRFLDGLVTASVTGMINGLLFFSTNEDGIVRNCIGRTHSSEPVTVDRLTSRVVRPQDVLDISHHPTFQTAVGFTAKEIDDLDDAFGAENVSRTSERLVDLVARECKPAVFTSDDQHQARMELAPLDPFRKHPLRDLDWDDADTAVYPPRDVMRLAEEKYGPFTAS
ncbi:AAA-ATPase-like domain-containing protein [Mycena kentingensis (nom. inval.)]|nr:AAA-ATPase-like domain-containing protein [Mycena kentingensis (nom. inval.)]